LWKTRSPFDTLNDIYVNCHPFEHLAVGEAIVLFRGGLIFKQYIPILLYKDLETLRHDWLHLQHEHMLGKGQAKCNTYDSCMRDIEMSR
jgi:hypothetical protein